MSKQSPQEELSNLEIERDRIRNEKLSKGLPLNVSEIFNLNADIRNLEFLISELNKDKDKNSSSKKINKSKKKKSKKSSRKKSKRSSRKSKKNSRKKSKKV